MPQIKAEWEEIDEFKSIASKLIAKYPERFSGLSADNIIAYGCTNKDRPANSTDLYKISGEQNPESFTNSKQYFVKFYMTDWEGCSNKHKQLFVFSALKRIDPEDPESGKIMALDYKDQGIMVRTFGPDWAVKSESEIPNLLEDDVDFIDEPRHQ